MIEGLVKRLICKKIKTSQKESFFVNTFTFQNGLKNRYYLKNRIPAIMT